MVMAVSVSTVPAAELTPIARWDFSAEEASPLQPHGDVLRDAPGPRPNGVEPVGLFFVGEG